VDLREALGSEFALLDPARELSYRGKSDVRVASGQRAGSGFAAAKSIALGARGLAGENGMAAREGRERGFKRDGARTATALGDRGQVYAPSFRSEGAIRG